MLASCASNPIIKTQTVTVKVPIVESVPSVLTQPVPEPKLKDGPITNRDLADWALALRQALREANAKLEQIAGLSPNGTQAGTVNKQGGSSPAH